MISNTCKTFAMYLLLYIHAVSSLNFISIKPGSLRGFYMFGICKYIRDNYDLSTYHFYGASAGAWNSLYLSKKEKDLKLEPFLKSLDKSSFNSLFELEENLKRYYLSNYVADDYNLDRLNICVSVLQNYKIEKKIYSNFLTLEDTINCCLASSHIPYITSRAPYYTFRNRPCIDGGFFLYPHHETMKPKLLIEPDMWKNEEISKYSSLYKMDNLDIAKLIDLGYEDAFLHRFELDKSLNILK